MEPTSALVVTVGAALFSAAPIAWAYQALGIGRRRAQGSAKDTRFWRAFAERFHLTSEQDAEHAPRIHGQIEGIAFSVRPDGSNHGEDTPMVMTAISRAAITVGTPLQRVHPRVRTGDEGFDSLCHATGEPGVVIACLDARARSHVTPLLAGGGRIDRGQATLRLPSKLDEEEARAGANLVFHAAFAIDHAPTGRLNRLLQMTDEDPVPAVRARALWAASILAPDDRVVMERLTRASRAPLDRHQDLVGRVHRGDLEGASALLVEADDASLLHLAALVVPHDRLGAVLTPMFGARALELQQTLAEVVLGADGGTRMSLLAVLAHAAPPTTEDGIDALRDLVSSCADLPGETFDLTMSVLVTHPVEPVSEAAIGALMRHGSVRAVPALHAAEASASRARADRIRSLIAAIQAQVGPVDAGRLSIAAEDERGRVSVAVDEAGPPGPANEGTP